MSYKYYKNEKCEFFPCHKVKSTENYNCKFCYCPLYSEDCQGIYSILPNGIKDCSLCLIPHFEEDYIIKKLIENMKGKIR